MARAGLGVRMSGGGQEPSPRDLGQGGSKGRESSQASVVILSDTCPLVEAGVSGERLDSPAPSDRDSLFQFEVKSQHVRRTQMHM